VVAVSFFLEENYLGPSFKRAHGVPTTPYSNPDS
jgi:hypothetical protein